MTSTSEVGSAAFPDLIFPAPVSGEMPPRLAVTSRLQFCANSILGSSQNSASPPGAWTRLCIRSSSREKKRKRKEPSRLRISKDPPPDREGAVHERQWRRNRR